MATALGVVCKKDEVLLAVPCDGELVDGCTEKLKVPALLEEGERLQGMPEDPRAGARRGAA